MPQCVVLGGMLRVDAITADWYSPHHITRRQSKAPTPAVKGATRLTNRERVCVPCSSKLGGFGFAVRAV